MGGSKLINQGIVSKENDSSGQWVIMEGGDDISGSISIESSFEESIGSVSSSSSDLVEDVISSSSSSSHGPLYELSDLMDQLPIKRGLSNHYQGKSQSFASLTSVKSIEDLAKKGSPYNKKKMKSCKSYGGCLDAQKLSPKATISKKASRGSFFSSSIGKRGTILGNYRPVIHVQKNL